jgi:cobalt-precorrin 5A hydrolase
MDLGEGMIVAGVGCRRGASASAVTAAIDAALARVGLGRDALHIIATPAIKRDEPGIAGAAAELGVTLILVPQADLQAAGARTFTNSARVLALTGVPSVAEAAALAAAGSAAQLIATRMVAGPVTCALADTAAIP